VTTIIDSTTVTIITKKTTKKTTIKTEITTKIILDNI
jgi:hypothetical protein